MPDLLPAFLTPAQREAIVQAGGPVLLVAGPDTRKTGVMVRRTAYLVLERGLVMRGVEGEKGQMLRDERRQGP